MSKSSEDQWAKVELSPFTAYMLRRDAGQPTLSKQYVTEVTAENPSGLPIAVAYRILAAVGLAAPIAS